MPASVVQYRFDGGLDENTAAELVEPGAYPVISNLVHAKGGALQRPTGWAQISASRLTTYVSQVPVGGTMPASYRLACHKGELVSCDGQYLNGYASTVDRWSAKALLPEPRVTRSQVGSLRTPSVCTDSAYCNGYIVVAATTSTGANDLGIVTWVLDAATKAVVAGPTPIVGGAPSWPGDAYALRVKVVSVGTTAILLADSETATGRVYAIRLDLSSPAGLSAGWVGGTTLLTTLDTTTRAWDVIGLSTSLVVLWANSSATTSSLSARGWSAALAPLGSGVTYVTPGNVLTAVALGGTDADRLYCAYCVSGGDVRLFTANPASLVQTDTPATMWTPAADMYGLGVERMSDGFCALAGSTGAATSGEYKACVVDATGGSPAPLGNVQQLSRLVLAGRPFVVNGRAYCAVTPVVYPINTAAPTHPDLFVVEILVSAATLPARPVANIVPRLIRGTPAGKTGSNFATPAHWARVSATEWLIAHSVKRTADSDGIELASLDFAPSAQWATEPYGDLLAIAGAVPQVYDGTHCHEIGYLLRPEIDFASDSGTGLTGTFLYTAVYEMSDGRGWIAISEPATPVSRTVTNKTINVLVTTLQCTGRVDEAGLRRGNPSYVQYRIVLYRTTNGGGVFLRVTGSEKSVPIASPWPDTVSFADTLADGSLGAPLYRQPGTEGTTLARQSPPPFTAMTRHQDRIFGVASETKTIWFSGQLVDGEEPWFNDEQQIEIPSQHPINALESLDGRLVGLTRAEIFFIDGQGPPDSGNGGDFSPPQFIATSVGCIDWRSTVVTPLGLFFRSPRGIELLNRSMTVENFFGRAVRDETNTYPIVTSAVYVEPESRVYFTCISGLESSPTGGIILVYDLLFNAWTTLPYASQVSAVMLVTSDQAAQPLYVTTTSAALIRKQNPGSYLDGTQVGSARFVGSQVVSPWFKLAGPQGYKRVRRVAILTKLLEACDLRVDLAFDYSPAFVQSKTWAPADLIPSGTPLPQVAIDPFIQKCEAIRVRIQGLYGGADSLVTGAGEELVAIALEVEPKTKTRRLPAGQTA